MVRTLPPRALHLHMRHGAGTWSGVGHSQVVVGRGLPDYGETLFLVHNWLQGRGHPAEGPFGAPEVLLRPVGKKP